MAYFWGKNVNLACFLDKKSKDGLFLGLKINKVLDLSPKYEILYV